MRLARFGCELLLAAAQWRCWQSSCSGQIARNRSEHYTKHMSDTALRLLLAVFPVAWGATMIFYMRRHPEELRMSYPQFCVMCSFFIAGGVGLLIYILSDL